MYETRSAGTENDARIRVTEKLIYWADLIFVMEKKHKQRILEKFSTAMENKRLHVLDIPDDFQFMDTELIDTLKAGLSDLHKLNYG
ncbi:MAG: protein tyrosine phosphatase [Opitutaceae bacterium]|nr:protein tyrosine phosphatase [Cytophagales bacterium]